MKGRPQASCSGESCLIESTGCVFEAASLHLCVCWGGGRGGGVLWFTPSPDPTHLGACSIGSALYVLECRFMFPMVVYK
jgi:hypothetical protein